jgi:FkbM family methyltransferase
VEAEVSVIGGSTLLVRTDDMIGRVLAVSGVWEPNVTAAFAGHLSAGDVCVDIGAHVGYYTLLASKLVGPTGHVYAFEPSPSNYRALCANLARNGAVNVTALRVAAGQTVGTALLHEGTSINTGGATLRPLSPERSVGRRRTVMVDVRPIASSIRKEDFPRIRVIKIDVEGYEIEVLRSLASLLDQAERLAIFLEFNPEWIDDPTGAEYVVHLCHAHRFKLYRLRNETLEDLFPGRIDEPSAVESIPRDQCDLLLER